MKKTLLLGLALFCVAVLALNASTTNEPFRPKKSTTTEVDKVNAKPYVYNITYGDNYIEVEIRCDHNCRVAVYPKKQISNLLVEAKRFTNVVNHANNVTYGKVQFSCASSSSKQCSLYDFDVEEIGPAD